MWVGFDRHLPARELTRDTEGSSFAPIQGWSVRENTTGITWPLPVGSSSWTTWFKNKWDGSDRRTNSVWFQCLCVCMLRHVQLFVTPRTGAHQAPLSMEFSGKNTGVGCYLFLQGFFLTQGSNPSLLLGRWILYHWATREAQHGLTKIKNTI